MILLKSIILTRTWSINDVRPAINSSIFWFLADFLLWNIVWKVEVNSLHIICNNHSKLQHTWVVILIPTHVTSCLQIVVKPSKHRIIDRHHYGIHILKTLICPSCWEEILTTRSQSFIKTSTHKTPRTSADCLWSVHYWPVISASPLPEIPPHIDAGFLTAGQWESNLVLVQAGR